MPYPMRVFKKFPHFTLTSEDLVLQIAIQNCWLAKRKSLKNARARETLHSSPATCAP